MHAQQARDMAAYNRWMNKRLYAVCAELSDVERREDRGAFFKSIHGTLNHLLLADRIWLGRFSASPFMSTVWTRSCITTSTNSGGPGRKPMI